VLVEIASTPRGADVFRLPSETKVGTTPWKMELPSEAGTQVFVIKKSGYADRRVEVDLRSGGKQEIKLSRVVRKSTAAAPPKQGAPAQGAQPQGTPAGTGPVRRKGEPVDPFRSSRSP
jgi:hypothetical protein